MLLLPTLIALAMALKGKDHGVEGPKENALVLGQDVPLGPLGSLFIPKQRLPGFPFELPRILATIPKQYRLFPQDSSTNYLSSARRCKALGGRLAHLSDPLEMEILACTLQHPIFIGSWQQQDWGGVQQGQCLQLWPGGVIVASPDGCADLLGSLCELDLD